MAISVTRMIHQSKRRNTWAVATLVAILVFSLSACGNNGADSGKDSDKLTVITTFTVIADMARNVAGDKANILSVTRPGAEIHNYQPTPKDIAQADGVDLVLWNGLGLELWFERFLDQLANVNSVIVTEGIETISINSGPYDGQPNPHAWMSPSDAEIYVDNIERALSASDPENASSYRENAANYKKQIAGIAAPVKEILASIPEQKRWLVTSEGAFSYMARDFRLQELFIWPINADSQGTPAQVKNVIDTVRENGITAVFSESTVSPKAAQQIARETGATYAGVLYVDSLSEADGPVPTYLDLIKVTAQTIADGLSQ